MWEESLSLSLSKAYTQSRKSTAAVARPVIYRGRVRREAGGGMCLLNHLQLKWPTIKGAPHIYNTPTFFLSRAWGGGKGLVEKAKGSVNGDREEKVDRVKFGSINRLPSPFHSFIYHSVNHESKYTYKQTTSHSNSQSVSQAVYRSGRSGGYWGRRKDGQQKRGWMWNMCEYSLVWSGVLWLGTINDGMVWCGVDWRIFGAYWNLTNWLNGLINTHDQCLWGWCGSVI